MLSIREKAPVLSRIADFIRSPIVVDKQDIHQAKRIVADTLGVAYSGVNTEVFRNAIETLKTVFGLGEYQIWGTEINTTLMGAVFFNTLSVSSTDFDEGHRKAVGHPASVVVPAALLLGKHLNRSSTEILHSIIIGYEIGTRFSNARMPETINTYSSGRWGAIGAAAAAANLFRLNQEQTIHALSLASVLSPAMLGGSIDISTGSMAKEGIPWAAQIGVQSTFLAASGFIGPYLFVDDHNGYDNAKLINGLGNGWLINSNYFKPYSCCRWLHTAIKEAIELRKDYGLIPEKIRSVEVEVFGRAIKLVDTKYPGNPVQAQFHLPYVVACALCFGQVLPIHFSKEKLLDKEIKTLIDKTRLAERMEYSEQFPKTLLSKVHIKTENGETFQKEINGAPWESSNPPDDEELRQKFLDQLPEKGNQLWESIFDGDFQHLWEYY